MKKFLLLPLLFIAVTASVNAQTVTTTPAPNPNGPSMKFDMLEHNFGILKQGESATYEFKFKNTGKEPLVISTAVGSCGCTVPDWPKEPIAPGKTGIMKVTFNSAGKMGAIDKTVTITSNNRDGQVVLHMKGEVKPAEQQATPAGTGNGAAVSGNTTSTTGTGNAVSTGGKTVSTVNATPPADSKTTTTTSTTATPKATKSKASKSKKTKSGGN